MCYSFEMAGEPEALVRRFALGEPPPAQPKPVLLPTELSLVIDGDRRAVVSRWGLPAPWDGKPLINARAESLAERRTFRPLLASRCLVPATAYFEWRRDGRSKLKNRILPAAGGLFALAGLWNGERFVVVTCPPAAAVAHLHDRMPVILDAGAEAAWLDPALPYPEVAPLLVPFAKELRAEEEVPPPPDQPDLFAS